MTNESTTATGCLASVVLGRLGDLSNAPMTVGDYISNFGSHLDARCFGQIVDCGGELALHGQHGEELLTREGAWLRGWKHSGRRVMATLPTFGAATVLPFVRCRKEEAYE